MKSIITFYIDSELIKKLKEYCAKNGVSASQLITFLLKKYLKIK